MEKNNEEGSGSQERDFRTLLFALALTLIVFVAEVLGGFLSNSLALLGDAGHVFSDVLSLGIAALALWLATRQAPARRTFGYHRAEVFAAFFNGALLLAIAMFLFASAIGRLENPPEVEAPTVFAVSIFGLLANLVVVRKLHGHRNVNVQAAFWHAASDALSSVGVVFSSVAIWATGFFWVDAAVSMMISIVIFASAVKVLRPTISILFESVPWELKIEEVEKTIGSVKGVKGLHDLHVWSICSEITFVSCHVVVSDMKTSKTACISEEIECELKKAFGITHATLQFETANYKCGKLACRIMH